MVGSISDRLFAVRRFMRGWRRVLQSTWLEWRWGSQGDMQVVKWYRDVEPLIHEVAELMRPDDMTHAQLIAVRDSTRRLRIAMHEAKRVHAVDRGKTSFNRTRDVEVPALIECTESLERTLTEVIVEDRGFPFAEPTASFIEALDRVHAAVSAYVARYEAILPPPLSARMVEVGRSGGAADELDDSQGSEDGT